MEQYINKKLDSFTGMVINRQIHQTDLLNTLQKFKIVSPKQQGKYGKGYWRDGMIVGGSHSVMCSRKKKQNIKIKLQDQSQGMDDHEMMMSSQ